MGLWIPNILSVISARITAKQWVTQSLAFAIGESQEAGGSVTMWVGMRVAVRAYVHTTRGKKEMLL